MTRTFKRTNSITVKVKLENAEAYSLAAKACKMTRHEWMRIILDSASGVSELRRHLERVESVKPNPS